MGKQGAFFAAHPGPEFQNHVFPVVGVLGQEQELQPLLQLREIPLGLVQLLLTELLHLRLLGLREHLQQVVHGLLFPDIGPIGLHHRLQLALLPEQPGGLLRVVVEVRPGGHIADLQVAVLHRRKFVEHFRSVPSSLRLMLF